MQLELRQHAPIRPVPGRPPLLFVHGAWHGAWCWDEHFLRYFARRGWHSYALSLRGHGASDGARHLRWASIRDYVDDVETVIDKLPEPPVMIGHSMGGFLVQKLLERRPFPAVVLIASIPPQGSLAFLLRLLVSMPLPLARCLVTLRLYPIVANPAHADALLFSRHVGESDRRRWHALLGDESFRIVLDTVFLALPNRARIRQQGTSMLVVAAEHDRIFTLRENSIAAQTYGAELIRLPGFSHDVMLDWQWDAAAARISHWLEGRFPTR